MQSKWLSSVRAALVAMKWASQFTATKVDDNLADALSVIVENPQVQALVEWLINTSHISPELTTDGLMANAPAHLVAEASGAVAGKIGDCKLLELLKVVLPLVLKFV
ncbi:MAG: hypothetical protein EBR82_76450 [Caulobacteraceae bacterium]|nr:hypothetical protein [Caulobacteraceae bacterium]